MKAWVRNSRRRARSCQDTDSAVALIAGLSLLLDGRWGTGADDLTRLSSDVAEAVGQLTGKIISVAGTQHARCAPHGELDAPANHDSGLFTAMRRHLLAGRGAGCVALVQHRELPCGTLCGNEPQRHLGVAELYQLICAEKGL